MPKKLVSTNPGSPDGPTAPTQSRNTSYILFSESEVNHEVLSSPSEPEEAEAEDTEFQAATQHLTEDFLCQVIQEEEGRGTKGGHSVSEQEAEPEKEEAEPHRQVAPLTSILGKLQSAASLSLQQTFQTTDASEPGGKANGEDKDCFATVRSSSSQNWLIRKN